MTAYSNETMKIRDRDKRPDEGPDGPAHRVLVVDDEEPTRTLLAEILSGEGYSVTAAADGYEALEKFRLEQPDLLITDLTMPVMDGYELCQRVREISQVPIIVITGLNLSDDGKEKAFSVGADSFLKKPFQTGELLAQVRALLALNIKGSDR